MIKSAEIRTVYAFACLKFQVQMSKRMLFKSPVCFVRLSSADRPVSLQTGLPDLRILCMAGTGHLPNSLRDCGKGRLG